MILIPIYITRFLFRKFPLRNTHTPQIVEKNTRIALSTDTSCAVKVANPKTGGMYNNIGYLTIEPPIPSIPDIKEPTKPIKNKIIISENSIKNPPLGG